MNDFPEKVKQKLLSIIKEMADKHWLFSKRPGADFSRQYLGKLSFEDTMLSVIGMGKGSTSDELMDYFDLDPVRIPSQSAFVQRRSQITLNAFEYLFSEFSAAFPSTTHKFKDKCILACDGTHVVYSTNKQILEDYNKPRKKEYRGYNHMHLNAFVDVISKVVLDAVIQPGQKPDEREAMRTMLDHFEPDCPENYIITADRGYESYDLIFQCLLKKLNFVFRVKAPSSDRSMLSTYADQLPDNLEEFDVTVKRFFTDKYTKVMKSQPTVYKYMNPTKNIPHFKALLNGMHIHYVAFRVCKIKVAKDTYQYIITNLPDTFDLDDIRECYHWRWGIEVAFRYLKHANGLLYFHAKKPEFLKQEIYANLILYNFGTLIANEAAKENNRKDRRDANKHEYSIDFSTAIKLARKFLIRDTFKKPVDIIKLMMKYVHAVKTEISKFDRPLRGIGAVHFGYR